MVHLGDGKMIYRFAQILTAAPLIASIALLSPALAQAPPAPCGPAHLGSPSKFDYVVLASFADSSNLLAMSTYRAP
jgi:hypothetical protein